MSALTYHTARKTFGETVALEGLDLAVEPGELISPPRPEWMWEDHRPADRGRVREAGSGSVTLNGVDISHKPAHKRNMGMVFQSYSLFPNLNVSLNVDFGLRTRKIPAAATQAPRGGDARAGPAQPRSPTATRTSCRVASSNASPSPGRSPSSPRCCCSTSRCRRSTPRSAPLRDEIRRIQTELGITTLLVTHDQEEALGISDRIGVMSQGHLEQLGTPIEVYRHPSQRLRRPVRGVDERARGHRRRRRHRTGRRYRGGRAGCADARSRRLIRLLVRPEDVRLVGDDDDAGLPGTVVSRTFQGASSVVTTRLDVLDTLVSAHVQGTGSATADPGTRVNVVIDGTRAVCETIEV